MPVFDRPVRYQASVFTSDTHWGSVSQLAGRLVGVFQPEIGVYPVPVEPDERSTIPRILMLAPDKAWQFVAMTTRCDLTAIPAGEEGIAHVERPAFWNLANQKLLAVVEEADLEVVRLAGVAEYVGRTLNGEGSPAEFIKNSFLSRQLDETWFNDLGQLEVHIHGTPRWNTGQREVRINAWTRLKAVRLAATGDQVLNLVIDFNTIAEAEICFTSSEVSAFYANMEDRVEDVFSRIENARQT